MIARLLLAATIALIPVRSFAEEPATPAGDTHEKIVADMLKTLKAATKAFADAKDAETAKKAKPVVEGLAKDMLTIDARIAKLGRPDKIKEAELEKKFKPELDEIVKTYQPEVQRLLKETYGKDLVAILERKPPVKPKDK